MDIDPNPQTLWRMARGGDTLRLDVIQLADRCELNLWKNTFILLGNHVATEWPAISERSGQMRAAAEADGWQDAT